MPFPGPNKTRIGAHHKRFDSLAFKYLSRLDEASKAALEKEAEREIVRAVNEDEREHSGHAQGHP